MDSPNNRTFKAYLIVTGAVFGLLTLAHVWRIIEEGSHLATDVSWVLITIASAALCLWAFRLLWRSSRS
jgi:hypothetical protein